MTLVVHKCLGSADVNTQELHRAEDADRREFWKGVNIQLDA